MVVARGVPLTVGPVMRGAIRLPDPVARAFDALGRPRRNEASGNVAIRDILLALREPPAKMFASCPAIPWLQRDNWQRSIDGVLADLADENADQGKSDCEHR